MNGGMGNGKEPVDAEVEDNLGAGDDLDETIVIESDDEGDNVGDLSVEINVDELVAKIELGDDDEAENLRTVKRRLDEAEEQKLAEKDLEGTYNFNLDDDL